MKGYKKKKFLDMEIYVEDCMSGSVYRPDNLFPIFFMKYLPYKFNSQNKKKEKQE